MNQITDIPKLPPRKKDSNKGDYGKILIVGGSRDFIGAPSLSANAALRSGAGLVTLAVPKSIQQTVISLAPCATSVCLQEDEQGLISEIGFLELSESIIGSKKYDVVAIGPGLGRTKPAAHFITDLGRAKIPLVIDADGLNVLSETNWTGQLAGPCVITPHPGELSRLLNMTIPQIQSDRVENAVRTADLMQGQNASSDRHSICLLKGDQTVVTDGRRLYINQTGNPGMATGGTGDILTGIIAALIGQNLSPFDAAVLGAHIHGLAGDLAAEHLGQISLIASDLLNFLPIAFKKLVIVPKAGDGSTHI